MDTKKCPKCKQVKTIDCFGEVWDHWKDRYKTESKCKACHKEYCKEYQSRRTENSLQKVNIRLKEKGLRKCSECNGIFSLDQFNYTAIDDKYEQKCVNCSDTKIRNAIRNRIRDALKRGGARKPNSITRQIETYLGCTIPEARAYLESKFSEGMSWKNHAHDGWHIDHIVPCAWFNLKIYEEQLRCFHFTNLQPLWAKENLSKGARWAG
tara:strand:- start:41 stop:667 length:627 start_codon:yes stop_codon:yes gene_type:complete